MADQQHQEYPKYLYHHKHAPEGKFFQAAEETMGLMGKGWVDTPAKFPPKNKLAVLLKQATGIISQFCRSKSKWIITILLLAILMKYRIPMYFYKSIYPYLGIISVSQVFEISKALLTPLIAVVTIYIAWQQWKTNEMKLKLDIYDRRLRVYGEVKNILSVVMRDANEKFDDLLKFRTSVAEADFLFGNEIPQYIDEIYSRGLKLWRSNEEYRDYTQETPEGYNHQKVVDEMNSQLTWFTEQFDPAKEKFKKYLYVSK